MAGSRIPPSSHGFAIARAGDAGPRSDTAGLAASAVHIDAFPHRLALIVEQEIVPRLMLLHRESETGKRRKGRKRRFSPRAVADFTGKVLADDAEAISAAIAAEIERGTSAGSLCLDLLAPTARKLGEMWETDEIDFVEVTLALTRLHAVLKVLQSPAMLEPGAGGRNVLLTPMPGDTHAFGVALVAEFFRASGWKVTGGTLAELPDLYGEVARLHYSMVGISLGSEILRPALAELIATIRQRSRNRAVAVVVGGPMFTLNPQWVDEVGADGMATDAREAVKLGERLLARQRAATR